MADKTNYYLILLSAFFIGHITGRAYLNLIEINEVKSQIVEIQDSLNHLRKHLKECQGGKQ